METLSFNTLHQVMLQCCYARNPFLGGAQNSDLLLL